MIHGQVIKCPWEDTAGSYTLRGRIDDEGWIEQSVTGAVDGNPACAIARGVSNDLNSSEFEFYVCPRCDRVAEYDSGCPFEKSDA